MSCNAMQRCARAYKPCVQLHVEMYGLCDIANLGTDMLTNPISCSIVYINASILLQFPWQTLVQTCLQTLSVVQLYINMHGFYGKSHCKPRHGHAYKPYSCSVARKMHGFYNNSHYKAWHRHDYKPYQLFNCT